MGLPKGRAGIGVVPVVRGLMAVTADSDKVSEVFGAKPLIGLVMNLQRH